MPSWLSSRPRTISGRPGDPEQRHGPREDLTFAIEELRISSPGRLPWRRSCSPLMPSVPKFCRSKPGSAARRRRSIWRGPATTRFSRAMPAISTGPIAAPAICWDWSFGVTLSVPIFSGFSTPNQVAEAKANLRNLEAQEETLRLNIRLEAEQAYLSLKEAMERITVTEKTVDQAKENYDLASGRYQVGVGRPWRSPMRRSCWPMPGPITSRPSMITRLPKQGLKGHGVESINECGPASNRCRPILVERKL